MREFPFPLLLPVLAIGALLLAIAFVIAVPFILVAWVCGGCE